MINTNGKMKKTGYALVCLCFIWSVIDYYTMKSGASEVIEFWVNVGIILIFGNTTKHLIGEKLKDKGNE